MKVVWPKCIWCGTTDYVFPCRACGKLTCGECLKAVRTLNPTDHGFDCIHAKFEPTKTTGWEL
jgi:hypothetical protein